MSSTIEAHDWLEGLEGAAQPCYLWDTAVTSIQSHQYWYSILWNQLGLLHYTSETLAKPPPTKFLTQKLSTRVTRPAGPIVRVIVSISRKGFVSKREFQLSLQVPSTLEPPKWHSSLNSLSSNSCRHCSPSSRPGNILSKKSGAASSWTWSWCRRGKNCAFLTYIASQSYCASSCLDCRSFWSMLLEEVYWF